MKKNRLTENQLRLLGFKQRRFDGQKWFEKRASGFTFITNDTLFNKRKDEWCVGFSHADSWNGGTIWNKNAYDTAPKVRALIKALTLLNPQTQTK